MKNNEIGSVIFKANHAWNDLYFDDFKQENSYQISWVEDADRPYYNCIHVDKSLDAKQLHKAEDFFLDKSSPPRVYTHTATDKVFIDQLKKEGYKELVEEQEIWYRYEAQPDKQPINIAKFYKHDFSDISIQQIDTNSDALEKFMALNKIQNQIPDNLASKFTDKIRNSCRNSHLTLFCFAAFKKDEMLTIGAFSVVDGEVFCSEGATRSDYSRLGLNSMMLAYRINLAYENKYRNIFVNCDKHAWSNHACKKVGFNEVFTRHLWEKRS